MFLTKRVYALSCVKTNKVNSTEKQYYICIDKNISEGILLKSINVGEPCVVKTLTCNKKSCDSKLLFAVVD
jgi:hypothetical protein